MDQQSYVQQLNPQVAAAQTILRLSARMTTGALNSDSFFSFLSSELRLLFNYDRFSIFLYDAQREFLDEFSLADGTVVERFSNTRTAHSTVAWQAIQTRKPIIIRDLASCKTAGDGAAELRLAGLNTTIAIPLIFNQEVIATLHLSFVQPPPNIANILIFLEGFCPVLSVFLHSLIAEQRRIRARAAQKEAIRESEKENRFPLEHRLLDTQSMSKLMSEARKVAKLQVPVLILGETGTGKSMLARWLHRNSPRRTCNFVKVNCPSLAPTLFESEMFGYAKGAFTGAYNKRIGRIELAQNGTLFLDEIGEIEKESQSKLLQVLEEYSFERVGETRPIDVDIRVLSATNIDLDRALEEGRIRRDLFYRLAPIILRIPPLRERKDDIFLLFDFFVNQFAKLWDIRPFHISKNLIHALHNYDWPGNIRELRNVVSRLLLRSLDSSITVGTVEEVLYGSAPPLLQHIDLGRTAPPLPSASPHSDAEGSTFPSLETNERAHILRALKLTGGRIAGPRGASALLGIPRSTLQHRMQKLNISAKIVGKA